MKAIVRDFLEVEPTVDAPVCCVFRMRHWLAVLAMLAILITTVMGLSGCGGQTHRDSSVDNRRESLAALNQAERQSRKPPCEDAPHEYVKNPNLLLRNGVGQGCLDWVRQALGDGTDADMALPGGPLGVTPMLVTAVLRQDHGIVGLLLKAGANPNKAVDDGNTALHYAVRSQNEVLLWALLAYGADPGKVNEKDERPVDQVEVTPAILALFEDAAAKAES